MEILHPADWHLGRTLYGQKRNHEFEESLFWLIKTIESETIDCLLVTGDIFDTRTPSYQK
jgi:exonuclease SbcD|tara:strand:+ start:642 stop:821 length:180 start_codon:yes stop_codon:yes gene_type:complete